MQATRPRRAEEYHGQARGPRSRDSRRRGERWCSRRGRREARIVREAEEKAARMAKDAEFLVEQELKQMRGDLQREAVERGARRGRGAAEEARHARRPGAPGRGLLADLGQPARPRRPRGGRVVSAHDRRAPLRAGAAGDRRPRGQLDALVEQLGTLARAPTRRAPSCATRSRTRSSRTRRRRPSSRSSPTTIGASPTTCNTPCSCSATAAALHALPDIAQLLREMADAKQGHRSAPRSTTAAPPERRLLRAAPGGSSRR